MTLEAWAYLRNSSNAAVVNKWSPLGFSYALEADTQSLPNGLPGILGFINYGGAANTVQGASPSTSRWVHLAATYDRSALRVFVDGKLVGTRAQTAAIVSGTAPLSLCARPNVGAYMNGDLDAVRVSKVARYAADFSPPKTLESDLNTVALYDFDGTLGDRSGNGNALTLSPGAWLVSAGGR
jgi:hypothetical protein